MDLVGRAAEHFGSLPALRTPEHILSFETCDFLSASIANVLLRDGLCPGEIVALVSPNTHELAMMLLGLLKAGMIAAPINCRFPYRLINNTLEKLNPRLILTGSDKPVSIKNTNVVKIASILDAAGSLDLPETISAPADMDRPVSIIHTSASTGTAKAAVHSFANHWFNAIGSNENIPFIQGDCWLLSLPFYHVGGYAILFRSLVSGASMALGNPDDQLEVLLEQFPVTHVSLVPTQLHRLLENRKTTAVLRSMKAVLLGGSPAPKSLIEDAVKNHIPVYLSYGSTEMGSQIATSPGPVTGLQQQSGNVLPFREMTVSEEGELLVRGKCLFLGYLNNGIISRETDSEGWFHTKDIGHIDEAGKVTVLGRKDNMFISGGENIHPEEIENALMMIEGISEALVVPLPDIEYGKRPAAFIRTCTENQPDEREIDQSMRSLVGSLKTPAKYFHVTEWKVLPGSQKTDRQHYCRLATEL
jgi:o-succinylbenzoate---CoA ligase